MPPLSKSEFASGGREGDHTRKRCGMDWANDPDSNLYERHKIQTGGDPAILPGHGIHPSFVLGGWCWMNGSRG